MKGKFKLSALLIICICLLIKTNAQTDSLAKPTVDTLNPLRVAILIPLYIDSAFDNNDTYKLGNTSMPKYMLTGLDFYNGVMLAIDSLEKENVKVNVWIFDTKKKGVTIAALMQQIDSLNVSLIIASFNNINEQKTVASFAFDKNIPLVSATYPNDAYVSGNPFFIMLNPTLKTHIENIYRYVLHNYPVARILYVTRKGSIENKIKEDFVAMQKNMATMNYRILEVPDNFTATSITSQMDSTKQNVIICGSVNENFGINLVKALSPTALSYEPIVIGMPTWDGLKALSGNDCSNVQIFYSTPFNFSKTYKTIAALNVAYKTKYSGRAGDMVYKGFESVYHFVKLLEKYPHDFINNISDNSFKIADDFIFEPVKNNPAELVPDYLENKKIYFVQQLNGVIKSVN